MDPGWPVVDRDCRREFSVFSSHRNDTRNQCCRTGEVTRAPAGCPLRRVVQRHRRHLGRQPGFGAQGARLAKHGNIESRRNRRRSGARPPIKFGRAGPSDRRRPRRAQRARGFPSQRDPDKHARHASEGLRTSRARIRRAKQSGDSVGRPVIATRWKIAISQQPCQPRRFCRSTTGTLRRHRVRRKQLRTFVASSKKKKRQAMLWLTPREVTGLTLPFILTASIRSSSCCSVW